MPKPGDRIKHYEIIKTIGKGGMGEVFLGQDTVLDRKVAIKFLPKDMQRDAIAKARLIREAKAAASLDHPFICKIFEAGEIDGNAYIVMEFVEGKDLREHLDKEVFPLRDALQMALEIGEALEEAHGRGIVHRDLKPSNIMLTPQGHVKVMDFGLAKQVLPEGEGEAAITKTLSQISLTEQGAVVGTIAYMSPEQARGDKIDARSDIFSLGILIYEITSGNYPFSKGSPIETLSSILRDSTPAVAVKPKAVSPLLSPILRKALAKDLNDRYQKVSDLNSNIKKLLREITGEGAFFLRKWPAIAGTALSIVLLLVALWFFFLRPKAVPVETAGPEPISVLIADFQNKTNDPVFDGALEHAITLGLEEAPFITAYSRDRARRLGDQLDSSADGRLDMRLAKLVSVQEGINVVIDGSIEKSGKGYTFKISVLDAFTSEEIAEASKSFSSKAEVLSAAVSLANEVISDLGGRTIDSAKAIAEETFSSSSIEAVKAYTRAQELTAAGKQEEAIAEFLKAIELDPNFGRAYSGLTRLYFNLGDREKAEEYHKQALAHIDNMTEREKYRTRIVWYLLTGDFQKAIEESEALVSKFPADSAGHGNLSLAYFFVRNMPKALEHVQKVIELFPKDVHGHHNASWYAIAAGNFELGREEANTILELDPSFEKAYICLALSELTQEMPAEAAENYLKLKTLSSWGSSLGTIGLADIALYEGRLNDAIEILKRGIEVDLENKQLVLAGDKMVMMAHAHLLLGQNDLVVKAADQAIATFQGPNVSVPVSLIYLQTGKKAEAESIMQKLGKRLENEPRAYSKIIEGEMSLKDGNIQQAIALFEESQKLLDTWLVHFSLGKAFLEAEAYAQAHQEFEVCFNRRGEASSVFFTDVPSYYYFPPVLYYLGRASEGLGSPAAADSYQKFLQIKLKADGDWMIEDARSRFKNL
jgi:tetratricopeptide (TPR) repeat protein/tRNA A-37 threonylcarbamoyl transferase component Bud32